MKELEHILQFMKLTQLFQKIERRVLVKDVERWENDVEHCYQLAMLAWYIVDAFKLDLDVSLVMKYGMIHDFVEVYAGDTYIYDPDPTMHESKQQREADAAKQLREEFAEFVEFNDLIDQYERKEDKESKFIYALDKIIPVMNIYLDNGRTWNKENVTLQMLYDHKIDKVSQSPEVKQYFDQLFAMLKEKESELFEHR
jgi:putative hydrolase of HD superfamily